MINTCQIDSLQLGRQLRVASANKQTRKVTKSPRLNHMRFTSQVSAAQVGASSEIGAGEVGAGEVVAR